MRNDTVGRIHDANWAFSKCDDTHIVQLKKKVSSQALPVDDGTARFIEPTLRRPHLLTIWRSIPTTFNLVEQPP